MRVLLAAALILLPLAAQAEPRTISIHATGTVAVVPDLATLQIGVETEDANAGRALDENSARAARLIATLTAAGVAEADIQTAQFSVSPLYAERRSSDEPLRVVGYRVMNLVAVTVRDLDALGGLLDQVVSDGANRIGGIAFGVADAEDALNEARRRAVADARARADLFAESAGVRLGDVLTIQDGGTSIPGPSVAMRAEAAVPVAAGSQQIGASVSITWEIEDD